MRWLNWLGAAALGVALSSCGGSDSGEKHVWFGRGEQSPLPLIRSGGSAPRVVLPEEPVTEAEAKEYGERLVQFFRAGNVYGSDSVFDWERFADRSFDDVGMNGQPLEDFKQGFLSTAKVSRSGLFAAMQGASQLGGRYKLIRVRQQGGEMRALIRLVSRDANSENGAETAQYFDFLLVKAGGVVKGVDVKLLTIGEDFSASQRRNAALVWAKDNPGVIQKIFGAKGDISKDIPKLERFFKRISDKKPQEALKTYRAMSEEVRGLSFLLMDAMDAAEDANDLATLEQLLGEMQRLHPDDPGGLLMAANFHATKGNHENTIAACEKLCEYLGRDGYMLNLIARSYLLQGKIEEARKLVDEGIQNEPDYAPLFMTRFSAAAFSKDHATAIGALRHLVNELRAPVNLAPLRETPEFAETVQSPEFKELEKKLGQ